MKFTGTLSAVYLCTALAVAAGASAQTGAAAAGTPAAPPPQQTLDGVVVPGRRDPLSRSDHRLQQLRGSLPELGSSSQRKKRLTDRAREYLSRHGDPEVATGQQRKMMERARQPQGMTDPAAEH